MIALLSGMISMSLLFMHSDSWKTNLPIWVILVAFYLYIDDIDDAKKE